MIDLQTDQVVDTFATGLNKLTSMVADPSTGNILFAEFDSGKLWRVRYIGTGAPFISEHPQDMLVSIGETARFSCSAVSSDTLNYQWLRNGTPIAGANQSELLLPNAILPDSGDLIRCLVYNPLDTVVSDEALLGVTSNLRPIVTITSPDSSLRYRAGEFVEYAGTAVDPETGPITGQNKYWKIDLHHDEHSHPFLPETPSIDSSAFQPPLIGETDTNVWFRIHLWAVDQQGMTGATYVDVHPMIGSFTLRTEPSGLPLFQEGKEVETPDTFYGVPGMWRNLKAPLFSIRNDSLFRLTGWDPGHGEELRIAIPDTHITYTAYYKFLDRYYEGNGDGLLGEYWNNLNLLGPPDYTQIDAELDFRHEWEAPTNILNYAQSQFFGRDTFSTRWSGDLLAPSTGTYTFSLEFNDHARFYLDGNLLIDQFNTTEDNEASVTVDLIGGIRYPVQIDYAEVQYTAKLFWRWDPPRFEEDFVPQKQLYSATQSPGAIQPPFPAAFVYPVPFRDYVRVYMPNGPAPDLYEVQVQVIDAMGKRVMEETLEVNTLHPGELDTSQLKKGQLYNFRITHEGSTTVVRAPKL